MEKIVIIYDDSTKASERVHTIIGEKSFGNIILKRKKIYTKIKSLIAETKIDIDFRIINNMDKIGSIESYSNNTIFFHLLSNMAIINDEEFLLLLKKLPYVKRTTTVYGPKNVGAIFVNKEEYLDFINEYNDVGNIDFLKKDIMKVSCFVDLSNYETLLSYLSGSFDARYFNSLQGDEYSVTKRSNDIKKMKMEYKYYWLLPEEMKSWMVMPYNYHEEENWASYTMERMPMTDIAVRWTHGAIGENEFRHIMDKVFHFFSIRPRKKISKDEYLKTTRSLYVEKVDKRVDQLKQTDKYKTLSDLIESGTEYANIDEIIAEYKKLYNLVEQKIAKRHTFEAVIGHGDVFFANMLYSKEVNLLRLIDPKGALTEADLWTNEYYDITKLSHSVCGNYDFFNAAEYHIELHEDMKFKLYVDFDNTKYKQIFCEYLKQYNIEYVMIRVFEASLFLSMLPLHMDNPHKVFGFVLNAINIMKEIEKDV